MCVHSPSPNLDRYKLNTKKGIMLVSITLIVQLGECVH